MKAHPAAQIFPMMSDAEMQGLIEDIKRHGQHEAIVLHEGMILDGRNRWQACQWLGVKPVVKEWLPNGTPEAYVISANLHRRHLSESQRALIAAKIPSFKRGQVAAQDDGHRIRGPEIAKLMNVGLTTINLAREALEKADPEEIAAIERGDASVSTVMEKIKRGEPPAQRTKHVKMSERGNNPERLQKSRMQAEIWANLDAALTGLTSLPLASDVAIIVRGNVKRSITVDKTLSRAIAWLEAFQNEWNNRG